MFLIGTGKGGDGLAGPGVIVVKLVYRVKFAEAGRRLTGGRAIGVPDVVSRTVEALRRVARLGFGKPLNDAHVSAESQW